MKVIDADAHVEESPSIFSRLDAKYYGRRPLPVRLDSDTVYQGCNAVWLIDGQTYPKPVGVGRAAIPFNTPALSDNARQKPVSIPAQELTDVRARLADMDKVGIGVQVVYPTLFLATTTLDVQFEAALCRSYNNFMADACGKSGNRIKFSAIVPIRDIEESIREMKRSKGLGAVGVVLYGVAWDKSLGHKDLLPFYEEAASLNIPLCIHHSWGSPAITEAFDFHPTSFTSGTIPVLIGVYCLLISGVLDAVPKLNIAVLEAGSMWVPYMIQQLERTGVRVGGPKDIARYFKDGRIFVGCEADEDINYLVQWMGEDSMVIGSDYPHIDVSFESDMTEVLMRREDVPLRIKEKILSDNPSRLYAL